MSPSVATLAVAVEPGSSYARNDYARALAEELAIPMADQDPSADLLLWVADDGLALRPSGSRTAVVVDFMGGRTGYRRISPGGKRGPLARALGVHKGIRTIIDATAGLGRDAFQLAVMGCTVTSVERNRVLAVMLRDAHARGMDRGSSTLRVVLNRLHFRWGDAREYLENLDNAKRPDAIYLDPMFPLRNTSALAKKEMRIVRDLVGDDMDAASLLDTARRVASSRVVVKRHPNCDSLAPDAIVSHGATRVCYDLYAPRP